MSALMAAIGGLDVFELLSMLLDNSKEIGDVWEYFTNMGSFQVDDKGHPLSVDVTQVIDSYFNPRKSALTSTKEMFQDLFTQGKLTERNGAGQANFIRGTFFPSTGMPAFDDLIGELSKTLFSPREVTPQELADMKAWLPPGTSVDPSNMGMLATMFRRSKGTSIDANGSMAELGPEQLDSIMKSIGGLIKDAATSDRNLNLETYLQNVDVSAFLKNVVDMMQGQMLSLEHYLGTEHETGSAYGTNFQMATGVRQLASQLEGSRFSELMVALGKSSNALVRDILLDARDQNYKIDDETLDLLISYQFSSRGLLDVNQDLFDPDTGLLPSARPPPAGEDDGVNPEEPVDDGGQEPDPEAPEEGEPSPNPDLPGPPPDEFSKYLDDNVKQKGLNRMISWYWTNRSTMTEEERRQGTKELATTEEGQQKAFEGHFYDISGKNNPETEEMDFE